VLIQATSTTNFVTRFTNNVLAAVKQDILESRQLLDNFTRAYLTNVDFVAQGLARSTSSCGSLLAEVRLAIYDFLNDHAPLTSIQLELLKYLKVCVVSSVGRRFGFFYEII